MPKRPAQTTESRLRRTQELGAVFWNDSCDLDELRRAVDAGAVGATSNPVLVAQAVEASPSTWTPLLDALLASHPTAREDEVAWMLRRNARTTRRGAARTGPCAHQPP